MNLFSKNLIILILIVMSVTLFALDRDTEPKENCPTKVLYSKEAELDQEIIRIIEGSKQRIYFSIYTFTDENIAAALISAKIRGIEILGIADFKQTQISQEKPIIARLRKYGIALAVPIKEKGIMHTKFIVTEKEYASGSFNWTYSAKTINDEVLEVGCDEEIRKEYESIFKSMLSEYKSSIYIPETISEIKIQN
jgi:phosphatidylserine/phosphatidylglycerophosphate/cardiolipin synthase-like enzyme